MPKYKNGDRVKIIRDTCCHGEEIGTIVTIYKSKSSFGEIAYFYVGGVFGKDGVYLVDEDIELVSVKINFDSLMENLFKNIKKR